MSLTDVSIVIPTRNRPRELRRLLSFLNKFEEVARIFVLDGSHSESQALNRVIVGNYANAIHLAYDPGLHLGLRMADGLHQVRTEFSALCGDDDFIFPSALGQCVEFLKVNPDYSAASGWIKTMHYAGRGWRRRGFVLGDALEHGRDISHAQFGRRMIEYFAYTFVGFIPLYYSLRRTAELRSSFSLVRKTMKYSSVELLSVLLALLSGKIRVLPIVSGIRDYSSETIRDPERDDPLTYFTATDLDYVRGVLLDKMVRVHGFGENIAEYTIDLCLFGSEHRLNRIPDSSVKARITAFWNDLQCLGSILRPDINADYLGVDRPTYRALTEVHRRFDAALPEID